MIPVDPAAQCPFEVERPVMQQRWDRLTFLHWRYAPESVQRLLPAGLTVETFDDRAWVGLVPFFMYVGPGSPSKVRSVPWLSRFCETNVRTYVRDDAGRSGIWFFSLDAARLGAVVVARTTYRLPYFWSRMSIVEDTSQIAYSCWRRWPGPSGASSRVEVEIGARYAPEELTARDHFLTARWTLFSVAGKCHRFARAHHAPWPLYRAVAACEDSLVHAAGLPSPDREEPVVHYSPGVDVRIGRPER